MANAISFFAGAGGLDIGIDRSGFDIKLTVELEKVYCETLRTNHPHANVKQANIMDYDRARVFEEAELNDHDEVDLIFGGSPCQSWSTAGKRQAFNDSRGQAMLKFADIVNEIQPKFFLLENVKGLLSAALKHRPLLERGSDHPPLGPEEISGSALSHILNRFGNYDVKVELLNAANFGVPQKRERVFIIGVRKDTGIKYSFPETTHNKNGIDGKLPWKTVGEVLEKLNVTEHHHINYSKERLRLMKMIPQRGGNWRDLRTYGDEVVQEAMGGAYQSGGGKVGFFRRINVDKPSPTLLTSPVQKSTNLGHPFEDRPLSIEEYLAIQVFPIGYKVVGTFQQQYIQIGNAVPILLSEKLGRSIFSYL